MINIGRPGRRGWRFGMNAKVNAQKELSPADDETRTTNTRLQDTAILFEEQVFTRTEADREGTIKIERGQEGKVNG